MTARTGRLLTALLFSLATLLLLTGSVYWSVTGVHPCRPAHGWTRVTFHLIPRDANIDLDGTTIRVGDEVQVRVERYPVTYTATGYMEKHDTVEMLAGRNEIRDTLTAIPVDPKKATLRIASQPPGAAVLIDGTARALTPFVDTSVSPRQLYTIEVKVSNTTRWRKKIRLQEGLNDLGLINFQDTLKVTLKRSQHSTQDLFADVDDRPVLLGGHPAKLPVPLRLSRGIHKISVYPTNSQQRSPREYNIDSDTSFTF